MARYIDATIVGKLIAEKASEPDYQHEGEDWRCGLCMAETALGEVPTADVAEVIRCKDCSHYIEMEGFEYNRRKARICIWHSAVRGENDYCSDAIRRPKEGGQHND